MSLTAGRAESSHHEAAQPPSLDFVLAAIQRSEENLLAALRSSAPRLNISTGGRWSPAQIADHLLRTERVMLLLWTLVPLLGRWPGLLRAADMLNTRLWLACGMRTMEAASAPIWAGNPADGRYRAPGFLNPSRRDFDLEQLLEKRRALRQRSLRAIQRLDDAALRGLAWTHPLLGRLSLLQFAHFLALHEQHHLPQVVSAGSDPP